MRLFVQWRHVGNPSDKIEFHYTPKHGSRLNIAEQRSTSWAANV